jgi:hypothetical protein
MISRLTRHGIAAGVLIISACSRPTPAPVPADALPTRLVLALDGVDYRDVQRARAEGRFAAFRAPSRLISTFPSISDVAWHDILDVQPPAGYQRVYFSRALQSVIEVLDITPARRGRSHHGILTGSGQERISKGLPQSMQCFAQGAARLLLVELGPQQPQQAITLMKAMRFCEHQEVKQRKQLGLTEQRRIDGVLCSVDAHGAEQGETNHWRLGSVG